MFETSFENFYFEKCIAKLKIVSNKKNTNVIILLPGQTMPPEMFFEVKIFDDNSTISEKIINSGYDVAFLNPVGFGNAEGKFTDLYTRDTLAKQIILVVNYLKKQYQKVFCHGYCSTGSAPLVAASNNNNIDGILLQSPVLQEGDGNFAKEYLAKRDPETNNLFFNDLNNLVENRLKTVNDIGRGYSMRPEKWERVIREKLLEFPTFGDARWGAVYDMTINNRLYYSMHGHHGWNIENIKCPIAVLRGEFDVECDKFKYAKFMYLIRKQVVEEIWVKNSTHFGFWDSNVDVWTNDFIKCINAINKE